MKTGYTITDYYDVKSKITQNEYLIQRKLNQVSDLQYEIELIAESSIEIIRGISDQVQATDLHKIWLDFDHDKGKFKPEGNDSKARFKFIEENYVFDGEVPKGVKLKDITLYGYGWALWIYYTYNGEEFVITLPCYKNVNKDNYKSLGYEIMSVDGCSYTTVFITRFLSELKDGVTKFLNK